jgi:predicted dehydrogenase
MSNLSPPRELPPWKRRREEGGGALLDLGSHQADLARFLFGEEVREVSATLRSVRTEDDDASITMTLASGLRVDARASFATVRENRFEILGDEGRIVVDRVAGRMRVDPLEPPAGRVARLVGAARGIAAAPRLVRSILAPARDPSYRGALSAFVRATRERSHPSPDLDDGERSLAVVLAAETAARGGRRTPVEPAA